MDVLLRLPGAIAAIGVSSYVIVCRRLDFVAFAATGMAWLTAFIAYSLRIFGTVIPYYYMSNDPHSLGLHVGMGLYGTLISPSRGILVFCPIVALGAACCGAILGLSVFTRAGDHGAMHQRGYPDGVCDSS